MALGPVWLLLGWVALVLATPTLGALDLDYRFETGWFNHAYQDRDYLSRTRVTFGVPYGALGLEATDSDSRGNVWALGLAHTAIGSGEVTNRDRVEVQPLTTLSLASFSVGHDWGWIEADLGVAALVRLEDLEAREYLSSDGQSASVDGGLGWNRQFSYTLVTGLLRIGGVASPHLALRLVRGPLSLTENLLHLQGVWPLNGSRLDAELGFSSPQGLWDSSPGVLRSNERLTVGWFFGDRVRWGVRAGFLLRTLVAGSGEVGPVQRLSLALEGRLPLGE